MNEINTYDIYEMINDMMIRRVSIIIINISSIIFTTASGLYNARTVFVYNLILNHKNRGISM